MPTANAAKKLGNWARRWGRAREVLREAFVNFIQVDSLTISASIAYYCLLSVFPMMLLLLGMSGVFLSRFELNGQLAIVLERVLPMKPDFIMQNLVGISKDYGRIGLISFLLLLWSSSGVFLPLEKALNRAWEVDKERRWWRSRLLSLEMALIGGFLVLASSALVALNANIHIWMRSGILGRATGLTGLAYHAIVVAASFGMSLAMFLVLFDRLPYRTMRFRQVLPSATLTAILWEGARHLFTLLLPVFNYHHVYGSIGVVVALMTWAYVSSAVILFGAQVSRAIYRTLKTTAPAEPAAVAAVIRAAAETP
jgi:membrane protein